MLPERTLQIIGTTAVPAVLKACTKAYQLLYRPMTAVPAVIQGRRAAGIAIILVTTLLVELSHQLFRQPFQLSFGLVGQLSQLLLMINHTYAFTKKNETPNGPT